MGEVTCFVGVTHLSILKYLVLIFLRIQDTWGSYTRDYKDRRVTPPKRVNSPTWGPHLHAKRPEEGIVFRLKDSSNSMGPVARRNFTLDVTGQPCCLVHSSSWVRPHTGRKLHGFLNQMQKFGHTQKAKFRVFAVYK